MGMGCAGAYADVIEETNVKKFCPKEYNDFMDAVGNDYDEFGRNAECNDLKRNHSKEQIAAYEKLQVAFEKKTGLDLNVAYHNSEDEGDRYDDVDGIYWYVNGMYELTPAGKKMEKYVERKNFVQFG